MIKMTFEFASIDEAIDALEKLRADDDTYYAVPPTPAIVVTQTPPPAPEPTAAPTFTLEQVRAKLAQLGQAGKKDEAMALLNEFGAKKVTELKPENYAALMAAAENL